MPRRPRVLIEGGIYHVYNRFARGAEVFREGDEAERFLGLLRKVRDRDGLTFFAWILMSKSLSPCPENWGGSAFAHDGLRPSAVWTELQPSAKVVERAEVAESIQGTLGRRLRVLSSTHRVHSPQPGSSWSGRGSGHLFSLGPS